ncbi:uncharacterized protein LOC119664854, partial [Teleopsis dalmanni]
MSNSNDSKPDNYQINAKICGLVEKYPCMYDRSHPHYLKKDVVDKAWIKIAKEMEDSISSCKERWRNIRTSFARSINVNKVPASANRTKPYYLHEELQFLAKHITPGIPVSRRSNASYYAFGEEAEIVEVSVGEESFDGFAAMIHDEEESQGLQSSTDETNDCSKLELKANVNILPQHSPQQLTQQIPQQLPQQLTEQLSQQLPQPTPQQLPLPQLPPQIQAAVQQSVPTLPPLSQLQFRQSIMEDEHEAEATPVLPMYPLKKRLRVMEPIIPEVERDIKPAELSTDTDFDAIFLQGLLPEMKAMDFRQKIQFKRRIYEVIGEIFENAPHTTSTSTNAVASTSNKISPTTTSQLNSVNIPQPSVNNSDLSVLRQLSRLIQNAEHSVNNVTVPKSVPSISSTVRSNTPATATVAVHRGAVTRSGSSLLRVTMVNPQQASSSTYTTTNS